MKFKAIFFHIVILSLVAMCQSAVSQSADRLWFQQPGEHFEETLVLGNGKMGASVFGGVQTEKIFLNDATLWSGEPVDPYMNPEAYKNLPAIREALKNENYKLADSLNRKLQGSFSQSYAPLGTLLMNFRHEGEPVNYYRELDLNQAISIVSYVVDGVTFTREYFVSHPDQIMAIKLTSSEKGLLNFNVAFESLLKHTVVASANMVQAIGRAPIHAAPSYLGNVDNAVVAEAERGTRFTSLITIQNTDGELSNSDTSLVLRKQALSIISAMKQKSSWTYSDAAAKHLVILILQKQE
jgi:alpha-L-fucosidase 2